MVRKRLGNYYAKEAVEFLNHVIRDKPLLPFLVPLGLFAWAIERWLVPFSNWVPLAFAVWATIQYGRYQRRLLVEGLNSRWRQLIMNTSPTTPLEPCAWLNKLSMEVWSNFMEPRISKRLSALVERRLKHRKPKLLERIELQEFSLGSCPPSLGQNGVHWITSGDQQVMRLGFEWNTNDMSVMLLAKLARPLIGTARIVINNLYIKGDLRLLPILDGQAVLYSFESTPEVRIGVAFGSGGSQSLPATELPGVSSWLVKVFTDTLVRMMVEPRRGCYSLPTVDLRKKAVGGVLSVTVVSASKLGRNNGFSRETSTSSGNIMENGGNKILQTFIEVELGDLTRRTSISQGSSPKWNATFNMVLHGESGILKFNLYEWDPSSVKYNYLTSCEIKMKYVLDDTTTFWAIGPNFSVLAKQAEYCGKEVEMIVPFEETNVGELTVKLVLKEWQYSDDSTSLNKASSRTQNSVYNSQHIQLKTGRKLKVTVAEGRSLMAKDKSGRCDPYVKVQYGKLMHKTKTLSHTTNPVWNHRFDFDEIGGGECLMIKCYNADIFGDENIGSARVNLDGLVEGSCKDVWIPLEKVNSGELRLLIEALNNEDFEVSRTIVSQSGSGWVELVLIEARDLIAADLRGTSDPYVRVQYGNTKKRTKVVHKTLNPQWNQILEFPDTGKQLVLHVKDHNALLPTSSIGDCVVEYEWLPPNQTADKWIPLQGVKSGEIHVKVTRKVPELQKNTSLDTDISKTLSKANKISGQVRELLKKLHGLIEDGDYENLSLALSEVENIEDGQVEYMLQLEKEKTLLLDKIGELGREISRTSSTPSKMPY
ncbi:synaptotagmin-5 isoform X1 [Dioscorea cayenensis subsp. rotundata]|uniref:Synaptotagmin-5 isoform X1 n=1 Tax=Dioscorea cayennensis subsp. rotundata TaxID=55577 RepID=A0AB40CTW6_DIOCR|nr:synaptotagmin-5 isoform X1 [Dioscorea cayenensis subsp. rotundata]